jgi:hypothetical protein
MGDIYTNPPQSRNEAILRATIDGTEYTAPPQSRIEDLLLELKEAIEQGGTGEGDMKKSVYDSDNAVATAGGIAAYVDDEITDLHLGTASTKNSTSVVTESTDLVESGAVKELVGWGNKNPCNPDTFVQGLMDLSGVINTNNKWITSDYIPCSGIVTLSGYKDGSKVNFCVRFAEYNSSKTFIQITNDVNIQDVATWSRTFTLNANTRYVRMSVGFNNEATTPSAYFATNRLQLEVGSTATAYEPYHASVDESKADNSVIGTVEDGTSPTKAYAVNEFMVRDGAFCQVTAPVTTSSTWTEGSNYTKKSIAEVLQSLMS